MTPIAARHGGRLHRGRKAPKQNPQALGPLGGSCLEIRPLRACWGVGGDGDAPELTPKTTEAALQTAIALWCNAIARWYAAVPLVGPAFNLSIARSPKDALSYISMILTIAYFAEPSTPDAQPAILTVANGGLATHSEALATARNTADQLQAHSFVIDFPDGTTERHIRDGERWREKDA
jgi:hypothetical protein